MKLKTLTYVSLITYCLLSTVCVGIVMIARSGWLDDQTTTCREDALAFDVPIYPNSARVYDEESGDETTQGEQILGYTSEAAFADVVAFYDTHDATGACTRLDDGSSARCLLGGGPTAAYTVEIKTGEAQTLYQTIITWTCNGSE